MVIKGTSARNAIPTHGGFNFSEFNIQKHTHPRTEHSTFSEQDRTHKQFAGRNPLNPTDSTTTKLQFGLNKAYGWREPTLQLPVPTQVQTLPAEKSSLYQRSFQGYDASLLRRNLRHGFGQNDPTLQHLITDQEVAPSAAGALEWRADPFKHSDVGVPSAVNQNMRDNPTKTRFPHHHKEYHHGRHDHISLKHDRTPAMHNRSNIASGTHHTHGMPAHPVTNGFRATRGPLERPLLLSDLPAIPGPQIRPEHWPGDLEHVENRATFLIA